LLPDFAAFLYSSLFPHFINILYTRKPGSGKLKSFRLTRVAGHWYNGRGHERNFAVDAAALKCKSVDVGFAKIDLICCDSLYYAAHGPKKRVVLLRRRRYRATY